MTRNQICNQLSFVQLMPSTLKDVRFDLHYGEFALLFEEYDPYKIRKNGSYKDQLDRVLKVFPPVSPSAYKKITKAVFLSAKFLSSYDSVESFEKEVFEASKDEKERFQYLNDFRLKSHLSSMYFNRTCRFFQESGLLDVPYLSKEVKEKARKVFSLEDDNEKLFFALLHKAKEEKISCKERQDQLLKR